MAHVAHFELNLGKITLDLHPPMWSPFLITVMRNCVRTDDLGWFTCRLVYKNDSPSIAAFHGAAEIRVRSFDELSFRGEYANSVAV